MKNIKLMLMMIIFAIPVFLTAQEEDGRKAPIKTNVGIEDALLKSGKVVKKNGKLVLAPSTTTISSISSSQIQRTPSEVEISITSHIKEIIRPFTPDQWKRFPGQDKMLLRTGADIEVLDLPTGSRVKELSFDNNKSFQPLVVSPNGNVLIYFDKGATYLYSFAKQKKELLLPHDKGVLFAWSPDSKQIVYEYDRATWMIATHNKIAKRITQKGYGYPTWSPKGDRIKVYAPSDKEHYWLVDPVSEKIEQFPNVIEGNVRFPNESKYLVLRKNEIYIKDSQTKTEVKIGYLANDNPAKAVGWGVPEISPDGSEIAYMYREFVCDDWEPALKCPNVNTEVFVYDITTGKTINVSNTPDKLELWTLWAMDGKSIFSISYTSENDKMPALVEIKLE